MNLPEPAATLVASFFPKPIPRGTLVYPQRKRATKDKPAAPFKSGGMPGKATGGGRFCSCGGFRSGVRWPGGQLTYPCSKAMTRHEDGSWEIDQP